MEISSRKLWAGAYNDTFRDLMAHTHERYTFVGGRASCKSSFVSLSIILLMLMHKEYNALIVRKYANTLRRSVFEQIVWAINTLGVASRFTIPKSSTSALPIKLRHNDGTEQVIIFSGVDDPEKIKSLKCANGYFAILWSEEKTEFTQSDLQNVRISALRGGSVYYILETYNPPASARHWCNLEAQQKDERRLVIHTTYLDIQSEWLGEAILHDIEHTKETNERAYRNIYLGEATGSGELVFENIEVRKITKDEINGFDTIYCGIDWGYYPDPYVFIQCAFGDACVYIFDELKLLKHSNIDAFNATKAHVENKLKEWTGKELTNYFSTALITADSSEPKSVADFKTYGACIRGAIKGVGSREASFKWLQGLKKIVIDADACPNARDEFMLYEHEIDRKTGEVMDGYPDGQLDHAIDATRYALERVWRIKGN